MIFHLSHFSSKKQKHFLIFYLLKCEDLLYFVALYDSKLNIFVSLTKQTTSFADKTCFLGF